jgi:hypothetical protein
MTSTVITDEIREIGRKALGVFWDDAPARQIGLAADTFLKVVAPMILEEAEKIIEEYARGEDGLAGARQTPQQTYASARATGARKAAAAIRALKEPRP